MSIYEANLYDINLKIKMNTPVSLIMVGFLLKDNLCIFANMSDTLQVKIVKVVIEFIYITFRYEIIWNQYLILHNLVVLL